MTATLAPTITLTARMFGRTIATEHATIAEAFDRVLDIALAQHCRIEGTRGAGKFIEARGMVLGSYDLTAHA